MFYYILLFLLATRTVYSCIPLGMGNSCNCQQNPLCGPCLPPIPPVLQPCSTCMFPNDVRSSYAGSVPFSVPGSDVRRLSNTVDGYAQALPPSQQFLPLPIPITPSLEYTQQPPNSLMEHFSNSNSINERDQILRNAIAEYNEKEHTNFPFPDKSSNHQTDQPQSGYLSAVEQSSSEYSGLPSIYFTMRPNTAITATQKHTTAPKSSNTANDKLATAPKSGIRAPLTKTTTAPIQNNSTDTVVSSQHSSNTSAYAFGSKTYWAVLEERQTEDGYLHQRRIPYHAYEYQVCTGATLGRSIEKDPEAVALKCTIIGCAAANVRLIAEDAEQFEAIYLKNVNVRRQIKSQRPYTCISIVDVPVFKHVHEKRGREIQKELESRDKQLQRHAPTVISPPVWIRLV